MKSLFKVLLGVLFLAGAGFAVADDDHRDDRHDDHARAVIVIPAHHYHHRRHHYHPVVHSGVELKVGIGGDHHDDHH